MKWFLNIHKDYFLSFFIFGKKDMKNKILLLVILSTFLFYTDSNGQDEKKVYKFEIGVETSNLIDLIFPRTGEFYNPPKFDYFLNMKYHLNKYSLRLRFGGQSNTNYRDNNHPTNQRTEESKTSNFNIALGLDKGYHPREKISINFGAESVLHFDNYTHFRDPSQNWAVNQKTKGILYGVNLIGGIQFRLRTWLSIGSEASARYYIEKFKTSYEYDNSIDNYESNTNQDGFRFLATNGIFLIVHF